MSILPLIASLLGTDEAKAKQFFASKEGKVPGNIPINLSQKKFVDIFGKEPKTWRIFILYS